MATAGLELLERARCAYNKAEEAREERLGELERAQRAAATRRWIQFGARLGVPAESVRVGAGGHTARLAGVPFLWDDNGRQLLTRCACGRTHKVGYVFDLASLGEAVERARERRRAGCPACAPLETA